MKREEFADQTHEMKSTQSNEESEDHVVVAKVNLISIAETKSIFVWNQW